MRDLLRASRPREPKAPHPGARRRGRSRGPRRARSSLPVGARTELAAAVARRAERHRGRDARAPGRCPRRRAHAGRRPARRAWDQELLAGDQGDRVHRASTTERPSLEMLEAGAVGYLLKGGSVERDRGSDRAGGGRAVDASRPRSPETSSRRSSGSSRSNERRWRRSSGKRSGSAARSTAEGVLEMVFQPICTLGGKTVGVEALARFRAAATPRARSLVRRGRGGGASDRARARGREGRSRGATGSPAEDLSVLERLAGDAPVGAASGSWSRGVRRRHAS